jgi:hypothetical protein
MITPVTRACAGQATCVGQKLLAAVEGHRGRRALPYFGPVRQRGATVVAVAVWQYAQLPIAADSGSQDSKSDAGYGLGWSVVCRLPEPACGVRRRAQRRAGASLAPLALMTRGASCQLPAAGGKLGSLSECWSKNVHRG